jgi:hypothetical protein
VLLDGSGHKGKLVYVEAVDDADQKGFSMFCIDDVRTVPNPYGPARPVAPLPEFDARNSIKLENDRYRVEVNRANGAITRILDKAGKLELIREPRLAGNFKFTLPLPGKEPWETIEANYILGNDQASPLVSDAKGSGVFFRVGARRVPIPTTLLADTCSPATPRHPAGTATGRGPKNSAAYRPGCSFRWSISPIIPQARPMRPPRSSSRPTTATGRRANESTGSGRATDSLMILCGHGRAPAQAP